MYVRDAGSRFAALRQRGYDRPQMLRAARVRVVDHVAVGRDLERLAQHTHVVDLRARGAT